MLFTFYNFTNYFAGFQVENNYNVTHWGKYLQVCQKEIVFFLYFTCQKFFSESTCVHSCLPKESYFQSSCWWTSFLPLPLQQTSLQDVGSRDLDVELFFSINFSANDVQYIIHTVKHIWQTILRDLNSFVKFNRRLYKIFVYSVEYHLILYSPGYWQLHQRVQDLLFLWY